MPQTMKREDGTFSREDFTFDKDRNVYICPAYGWFTEGFDAPDLKQAKALLEELNSNRP
jgi:hypothetical protein